MAVESARAFLKQADSDPAFAKTVSEGELEAVARNAGYEFTRAELDQARAERRGKLSGEDLGAVSGGDNTGCYTGVAILPGEPHNNPNPKP